MKSYKKKRKNKLKQRRRRKSKIGVNTPFTLSNYPKKLGGRTNSYEYKINIHNCCFNDARFYRMRYRAGHITYSFLRRVEFDNVDYIYVNFKNTSFKNSSFNQVVFNGCNLTGIDFSGCKFKDVYFINCKIDYSTKTILNKNGYIINNLQFKYSDLLKNTLLKTKDNKSLENYNILLTKQNKANKAMLYILLKKFTEEDIIIFLTKAINTNKTQMYTIHDYINSMCKYYKIDV